MRICFCVKITNWFSILNASFSCGLKYFIEAFLFHDKWEMKKFGKAQNKNYLE